MRTILLGIWLSYGADAATTNYALNRGGREILIPSQNVYVINGVVAGEAYLSSHSLSKFSKKHPKAAKLVGIGMIAVRSFVVYHNVEQLRKH